MLSTASPEVVPARAADDLWTRPLTVTKDPLDSVRYALGAEEHLIRVNDVNTRETYNVTLSRTMPYASPSIQPLDTKEALAHVSTVTPPPSRRRFARWMRASDDDPETQSPGAGLAPLPHTTPSPLQRGTGMEPMHGSLGSPMTNAPTPPLSAPSPPPLGTSVVSPPDTPHAAPPLANMGQMLGPSRSQRPSLQVDTQGLIASVADLSVAGHAGHSPTATSVAAHRVEPRTPRPVGAQTSLEPADRTFDEEMAENANALRRSWRAKHGHDARSGVPRVLKGNLIGEGHANYVLMYHMLTGIRIAVSRSEGRAAAPITAADFHTKCKFTFDIIGNELTPSSNYDFKFKDYAPAVFRELRRHFQLDTGDYLLSLAAKYILSELGSPGKSGSFFYFSHDYRFIIKTIRPGEHKLFLRFLQAYYEHVQANPQTLLSQFYGLHRVKLPGRRKIHFVIMNNLFPPHRDVHEVYDLKGSTVSREQTSAKPTAVLKDMNWLKRERVIELGPTKRALFEQQLRRDVALLQRLGIMDYSLLIGLHDLSLGNEGHPSPVDHARPMLRRPSILVSPVEGPRDVPASPQLRGDAEAPQLVVSHESAPDVSFTRRPSEAPNVFYRDEGGFRATDEHDRPLGTLYYMGIIDIFTLYNAIKRSEHMWKGLWHDRHAISPVPPREYGERFVQFLLRRPTRDSRP
ncbi:1-phosphatidylinositol-4-phosphate 5-kinase [Malassezia caprae]|uniref:1-phosphatidylinositol-4-phosphate 5-kinase n=1 Tax=Malassezia caprae TaxID=1381934 RepID=A0AAF0E709_9BASI|nr:1-phosphatidylinositol-4-phosphate 5-kinase [Malassezia caprae]